MEILGLEYGEKSKYFVWSLFLIQSAVFIQTYKNWAFLTEHFWVHGQLGFM